ENFPDLITEQFVRYDPEYVEHRRRYGERLEEVAQAIARAEADGHSRHCSQQMFLEAKWLQRYTAKWSRLDDKLKRIEASLTDTNQDYAAGQSPVDGFWGPCYGEMFLRIGASISGLERLAAEGKSPRYQLRP